MMIIVPGISGLHHSLTQNTHWIVFVVLELVANYSHLTVEVSLGDKRVDHAIGFQAQSPFKIFIRRSSRSKGLVVSRAVVHRHGISLRAVPGELVVNVGMSGRSFEH